VFASSHGKGPVVGFWRHCVEKNITKKVKKTAKDLAGVASDASSNVNITYFSADTVNVQKKEVGQYLAENPPIPFLTPTKFIMLSVRITQL
jgi:hypothetical protein